MIARQDLPCGERPRHAGEVVLHGGARNTSSRSLVKLAFDTANRSSVQLTFNTINWSYSVQLAFHRDLHGYFDVKLVQLGPLKHAKPKVRFIPAATKTKGRGVGVGKVDSFSQEALLNDGGCEKV